MAAGPSWQMEGAAAAGAAHTGLTHNLCSVGGKLSNEPLTTPGTLGVWASAQTWGRRGNVTISWRHPCPPGVPCWNMGRGGTAGPSNTMWAKEAFFPGKGGQGGGQEPLLHPLKSLAVSMQTAQLAEGVQLCTGASCLALGPWGVGHGSSLCGHKLAASLSFPSGDSDISITSRLFSLPPQHLSCPAYLFHPTPFSAPLHSNALRGSPRPPPIP